MTRSRVHAADVAPDHGLDRARLNDLLETTALGRTLTYQTVCASTNDLALRSDFGHGHLIVCDHQTRGRGRQDRQWVAPVGTSLLASLVISWQGTTTRGTEITFVAAIAVCSALRALGIAASHIKWPNDILVGERKICGILCESRSRGGVLGPVVVGIGVNLSQTAEELPAGATSVRMETGAAIDREAVLAEVLNRFEAELSALRTAGFAVTRSRWEALSTLHRGARVRCDLNGAATTGVTAGINADGAILVTLPDGSTTPLLAGEVQILSSIHRSGGHRAPSD